MLNNFKIANTGNVFVVSDTHFNHNKEFIFKSRGFTSIAEHDSTLVKRWNSVITDSDTVIHLGDFIANDPTGHIALDILSQLRGQKYLLWGNHKSGIKQLYKTAIKQLGLSDSTEVYPLAIAPNTYHLGDTVKTVYKGHVIVMHHYPLSIWEDVQNDSILLCGHSHGGFEDSKPYSNKGGKILDVGIDIFGCPILLSQAIKLASDKPTLVRDAHIAGL